MRPVVPYGDWSGMFMRLHLNESESEKEAQPGVLRQIVAQATGLMTAGTVVSAVPARSTPCQHWNWLRGPERVGSDSKCDGAGGAAVPPRRGE